MKIVYCSKPDSRDKWRNDLERELPGLEFRVWPDIGRSEDVCYALVWRPPHGMLKQLPNLKAIMVLGAGVDSVLADPELPDDVPVIRLLDAGMGAQMAEYAIYGVLHFHRHMIEYSLQQKNACWNPLPPIHKKNFPIGIMGFGILGAQVGNAIAKLGYPVLSWSLTRKAAEGIRSYSGKEELGEFLSETKVLINLLPLTPATSGIINSSFLASLRKGSFIINLARGCHMVDADVLSALDSGQLEGIMLDVFVNEPLPSEHPYWRHPKVIITPHVAALTIPSEASSQVIDNIRRMEAGQPPLGAVDRHKGY